MKSYTVDFPGKKKVDVNFKEFHVKTDQAIKNEGDGTAPEPFDLFLSSLAACAGFYAKSFCDTRNINSDHMSLSQEVYFKKGQKLIDEIKITLKVNKCFPEKYKAAIIKSMDQCAVKNQIHPDIKTQTDVRIENF